jgi:hypothetical protein
MLAEGATMVETPKNTVQRFQGSLFWADIPFYTKQRELTTIDRAILRPDKLLMEFILDGAPYHVELEKASDGTFRGTWERGSGVAAERGHVECKLDQFPRKETGEPPEETMKLEGKWFEDIDWRWFGRLEPVSHFTPVAPAE